jgi:AcrR family transcriptional regulator
MPLPECSVLWPTNRAEKGIDAAKLTFKLTHYHRIASALPRPPLTGDRFHDEPRRWGTPPDLNQPLGAAMNDAARVTPAGLLHHFESKEQLLHAVLDARDFDDDTHADRGGDLIGEIAQVADRFTRSPELIGTFTVLLAENILPDAPLHDRLLARHRSAIDIVVDAIRRGQAAGRYRTDIAPAVKAVEILAFVHGMETTWLLDPSIPLSDVFKEYAETLARDFAPPKNTRQNT